MYVYRRFRSNRISIVYDYASSILIKSLIVFFNISAVIGWALTLGLIIAPELVIGLVV